MQHDERPQRILVPIVGGDISEATLEHARSVLHGSGARLVLVHVVSPRQLAHGTERGRPVECDREVPRWQRLAASVPADRLFVDAALGEPAEVIMSAGRRADCDLIVLDHPEAPC